MKKLTAAFAVVVLAGCGPQELGPADDAEGTADFSLTLSPAQAQQVLDLVNYPGTDLQTLDVTIGLDSRAAKNIVALRNGPDGAAPTGDDRVFERLADLDAVPLVGNTALTRLQIYAAEHPAPQGEIVKGVGFRGWESQSVVWGVNHATIAELDALLDDRAASSLLAHRPFTSVTQMGAGLSYVGASAIGKLQGGALGWWGQMRGALNLGGRFDGAVFSEAEAEIAIQIVNQATAAQLTAHGVSAAAANVIVSGRPYTTLAQVSARSGIGSATMNALLAYAQSGQWGASCVQSAFADAVGPQLPALLFMSESDRPIELVSFAGAGGVAPTGASVLALLGKPAGYTAEVRDVANYYVAFEPSSSSADPSAAAAVEAAISAQLTDVIYVAIHAPAGSIDQALVDVYLVGRNCRGDLVGLHAIAVET